MRRMLLALVALAALLAPGSARAQPDRPPTIFSFTSDVSAVTVEALEAGAVTAALAWHVAHVTDQHRLALDAYQGHAWIPLTEGGEVLPPVGRLALTLTHPRTFGPPTYRLSVLDSAGRVLDERMLVIPYATEALAGRRPVIESFTAGTPGLDAAALAYGTARVEVAWKVRDRLPLTNLVFDQVVGEAEARNVELPREDLWVPSEGTGVVAPIAPPNGGAVILRLRVVDVITAEVYDEMQLRLPVIGTAMPPTATPGIVPTPTPPATTAPLDIFGDLVLQVDCSGAPDAARGWVDGPGMPSPDTLYFAYSANAMGASELIIARADGTSRVAIAAPDVSQPLATRPRWSPDSQRVAFANIVLSGAGGGVIYTVSADGTDLRRVASYTGVYDDLAWSPDSTLIYFTSGETTGVGSGQRVVGYRVFSVTADGLGRPQPVAEGCLVAR